MPFLLQSIVDYLQWMETGDQTTFLLMVFVVCLLAIRLFYSYLYRRSLPPGPRGVPFLGYLPYLKDTNTYLHLHKLGQKFGSVFRLQMGVRNFVVLTDYNAISEALKQDVFSARPVTPFTDFFDDCGIVNTSGEIWRKQRKFAQLAMRKFGVHLNKSRNRTQIQNVIDTEVKTLLTTMMCEDGKDVDLHVPLATCSTNVIGSLLMGVQFECSDPKFRRLLFLMDEGFRLFSVIASVNFIPALQYIPGIKKAYKTLMNHREEMFTFLRETVESHKMTNNNKYDSENQDFIDLYMDQINANSSPEHKKKFNEDQLYQILADLLTSGMETTRVTLQWFLLYVASNEEVRRNIQNELDTVIGRNRLPSIEDMGTLPYTEAVICETQRISNVLAIAPAHATSKDTTLNGFFIPRDSLILPLLYSVHKDEKVWKNPNEFDPTRFLSEDGTTLKRHPHFIPFGIGRRQCLGLVLARMELFCIGASILQQFDVSLPSEYNLEHMIPISTTTLSPPPHKITISSRQPLEQMF